MTVWEFAAASRPHTRQRSPQASESGGSSVSSTCVDTNELEFSTVSRVGDELTIVPVSVENSDFAQVSFFSRLTAEGMIS